MITGQGQEVAQGHTVPFPTVKYAYSQSELKGEDVVLVTPRVEWPTDGAGFLTTQEILTANDRSDAAPQPSYEGGRLRLRGQKEADESEFGLFCVFDGHHGREAALHCRDELLDILMALLPGGPMPPDADPFAVTAFCQELQKAIMVAFMQLQHSYAVKGKLAGSTATVVLQAGWVLTTANVGDSLAVLDTGTQTVTLTADHRLSNSKAEQERLRRLGAHITNVDRSGSGPAKDPSKGMGPLRIWPGGVANARTIGDLESNGSQLLLPSPAISQVCVPSTGGRVIMASDGLWDCFESKQAARLARRCTTFQAADHLITNTIRAQGGLRDDISLIVIDLLPPGREFPQACAKRKPRSLSAKQLTDALQPVPSFFPPKQKQKGGFCCFAPRTVELDPAVEKTVHSRVNGVDASASSHSGAGSTGHGSEGTQHPAPDIMVMARIDAAEVMGLVPVDTRNDTAHPNWQDPTLVAALKDTQEESAMVWQQANRNVKSGLAPVRSLGGSASLLDYFRQANSSAAGKSRRKKGLRRSHTAPGPRSSSEALPGQHCGPPSPSGSMPGLSCRDSPQPAGRASSLTRAGSLHRSSSRASMASITEMELSSAWAPQDFEGRVHNPNPRGEDGAGRRSRGHAAEGGEPQGWGRQGSVNGGAEGWGEGSGRGGRPLRAPREDSAHHGRESLGKGGEHDA